jgi:ParB family chromosome partitioning protein
MPKASRDSLNAKGKRDAYMFDPEDLILVTDEKHPLYDERVNLPVNEALVLNLLHAPDGVPQGIIEPITVVRNPESGKVEVAVGRQRVKAAREANKRLKKKGQEPIRVPAMIARANAYKAMGILISENEHRQDDTPLGRARKAQRYLELGRDEKEIAVLFGISEASVKNMLALLDAPAAVRHAVEAGKITMSDGYKLAKLDPSEAKEKVVALIEHAPRTPGKKRSKNGKKAREIMGEPKTSKISKKAEEAIAIDIAVWLEEKWKEVPDKLIRGLRDGEWRQVRSAKRAN